MPSHIPVLAREVVELLRLSKGAVVIDATLGAGGHSQAILNQIGPKGIVIGIDKDKDAITVASKNLSSVIQSHHQLVAVRGSYTDIDSIFSSAAKNRRCHRIDGILFDLGLSSLQLESGRGFSFATDAPLDMRFDQSGELTAASIVNSYSQPDLADILWQLGEERASRRIAKAIFEARKKQRIRTTQELAQIIAKVKPWRRGKIHPATLTFQALRMAVNSELTNLTQALPKAIVLLKPGGRLAVISYHSLEDRIVKNIFRDTVKAGLAKLITKKPIRPAWAEIKANPRSRSAKLRVIEKV